MKHNSKNNLPEINHASMPLGIFASESVSHKTNVGWVGTPPYVAKSVSLSDWLRPISKNLAAWLPSCLAAKKTAFTLAEVLITLGIIGVVAAITIPTIINKYQVEVLKNQLKKSYSSLSQAVLLAQENVGVTNFTSYCTEYQAEKGYINSQECSQAILKQLKFTGKTCLYNEADMFTYSKTQKSPYMDIGASAKPRHGLPDGTCVNVIVNGGTLGISVDINGCNKGPNALGHDIFAFWVNNKGLTPIKAVGHYNDEELLSKLKDCNSSLDAKNQTSCSASVNQAGYPCSKQSNQKGNGLGCSWYAINDISPDNPTKGYWENLPR